MGSLFKPKGCKRWRYQWKDHKGRTRTKSLHESKRLSKIEALGMSVEHFRIKKGYIPPPDEKLPPRPDGIRNPRLPKFLRDHAGVREIRRPLGQGIYFLYRGKELLYVGQTHDLFSRLQGHAGKKYSVVYFAPVPEGEDLDEIERRLIQELRPPLNIAVLNCAALVPG